MRRDSDADTNSTDEDGDDDDDDDASAGSELWAILDASLDASTVDSVLAFPGRVVGVFPIVEEADFPKLPALFSGPMSLVALSLHPSSPQPMAARGYLRGKLFCLGLVSGLGWHTFETTLLTSKEGGRTGAPLECHR
jgi:hypothetical protein